MLSDVLGFLIAQFILLCAVMALAAFHAYQLWERSWFYRGPHRVPSPYAAIRDGLSDAILGEPWQPKVWWLFWLEVLAYGLIGFLTVDYLVFYQIEREPLWLAVLLVTVGLSLYCLMHEYFAQLPPGGLDLPLRKTWHAYLRWGFWLRQFITISIALSTVEITVLASPTYNFVDLSRYLIVSELQVGYLFTLALIAVASAATAFRLVYRLNTHRLTDYDLTILANRRTTL